MAGFAVSLTPDTLLKENFDKKRSYDWLIVAQSYLEMVLFSTRFLMELKTPYARGKGPITDLIDRLKGTYYQDDNYLIFPILYNFKHGIELYLKAIEGIPNQEFTRGHNLEELTKILGSEVPKVKKIIEKYAYCQFLLPENDRLDDQNQFERYPQRTPYDNWESVSWTNEVGEAVPQLELKSLEEYYEFVKDRRTKNNLSIEMLQELVEDIEFVYAILRDTSLDKVEE